MKKSKKSKKTQRVEGPDPYAQYTLTDEGLVMRTVFIKDDGTEVIDDKAITNFRARIVFDTVQDDDSGEVVHVSTIEASRGDRTATFSVSAQEYAAMLWPTKYLGRRPSSSWQRTRTTTPGWDLPRCPSPFPARPSTFIWAGASTSGAGSTCTARAPSAPMARWTGSRSRQPRGAGCMSCPRRRKETT